MKHFLKSALVAGAVMMPLATAANATDWLSALGLGTSIDVGDYRIYSTTAASSSALWATISSGVSTYADYLDILGDLGGTSLVKFQLSGSSYMVSLAFEDTGATAYIHGTTTIGELASGEQRSTLSVAVPGPIAGAGLPMVLAFAGYALYRRRTA